MAEALILDAEAVNAMAHARDRGVLAERARAIARVALERQAVGALLTAARLDSAHAVDALVVATAMEFTRAVIATGDGDDLRRLAANAPAVRVFDL